MIFKKTKAVRFFCVVCLIWLSSNLAAYANMPVPRLTKNVCGPISNLSVHVVEARGAEPIVKPFFDTAIAVQLENEIIAQLKARMTDPHIAYYASREAPKEPQVEVLEITVTFNQFNMPHTNGLPNVTVFYPTFNIGRLKPGMPNIGFYSKINGSLQSHAYAFAHDPMDWKLLQTSIQYMTKDIASIISDCQHIK